MKAITTLLLILCFFKGISQENEVYVFTKSVVLNHYDLSKKTKMQKEEVIQKGWRFVIDQPVSGGKLITFLKWSGGDDTIRNQTYYEKTNYGLVNNKSQPVSNEKIYFFIDDDTIEKSTKKFVNENPRLSFVTGALTIPIKLRPSGDEVDTDGNKVRPFDFTGDVNIGLSIGIRIRLDNNGKGFLIPSAGLNLTSVSIDESTVKNGVITSKTNASSFTPFVGLTGEYDKFQASFLVGWDKLSGRTGENWVYQGKPWLGIGLGFNIFNTNNNNPKNNK